MEPDVSTNRRCPAREARGQIKTVWALKNGLHQTVSMGIERYGITELPALRAAGRVAAETLRHVGQQLKPGMSTRDIDMLVREDTARRGGKPSQLGYHGFPATVCTSRNHVVCHGIPSPNEHLREGDIINVDVTTYFQGFHGDTSATFVIGQASSEARRLVEVTQRALWAGIEQVRPNARLGDIGAAISELAKREGYTVVKDFGGHGIGRLMHMEPHVSHFGERGRGLRIKPGMTFTIEPMLNQGTSEIRILEDEWTVVTADGKLSAQFEHTIHVTDTGFEVLTQLD
ncbi:MAG TPA: type I methionyl aminopeptidase [Polyangiales bacterium]|nr:type I methionyl aminopeptidase [Polyangiales bacterium]